MTLSAETVVVRHTEGIVHGFLALRTLDGTTIADGDLIQFARGNRVTTRLVFHFKDGSLHDETAVYSQRREFRLLSDHLVQRRVPVANPTRKGADNETEHDRRAWPVLVAGKKEEGAGQFKVSHDEWEPVGP